MWHQIDTAPRDGTTFLAYAPKMKETGVCRMENISTKEPLWWWVRSIVAAGGRPMRSPLISFPVLRVPYSGYDPVDWNHLYDGIRLADAGSWAAEPSCSRVGA